MTASKSGMILQESCPLEIELLPGRLSFQVLIYRWEKNIHDPGGSDHPKKCWNSLVFGHGDHVSSPSSTFLVLVYVVFELSSKPLRPGLSEPTCRESRSASRSIDQQAAPQAKNRPPSFNLGYRMGLSLNLGYIPCLCPLQWENYEKGWPTSNFCKVGAHRPTMCWTRNWSIAMSQKKKLQIEIAHKYPHLLTNIFQYINISLFIWYVCICFYDFAYLWHVHEGPKLPTVLSGWVSIKRGLRLRRVGVTWKMHLDPRGSELPILDSPR